VCDHRRVTSGALETRTCRHHLDPRGFVHAVMNDGAEMDLADAQENVAAIYRLAGERRTPVLVDMRGVRRQSREARQYFAGPAAARMTGPVALLISSPVSRVLGNFYMRFANPIETALFTSVSEAVRWLVARSSA
jgi:hypothetical protein